MARLSESRTLAELVLASLVFCVNLAHILQRGWDPNKCREHALRCTELSHRMPGYATRRSGPFFPTSWPWGHGSPIDLGVMSKGRIHCRAGLWYSHSFDNRGGFDNHWERGVEGRDPSRWSRSRRRQLRGLSSVEGNVTADDVVIGGRLIGSVRAFRLMLQSTSHVEGDLIHQKFSPWSKVLFSKASRIARTIRSPQIRLRQKKRCQVNHNRQATISRSKRRRRKGRSCETCPSRSKFGSNVLCVGGKHV